MRCEYVVTVDTAPAMARAASVYRLTRPAFYVGVLVELGIAAMFAAAGRPGWALVVAVLALGVPAVLLLQTRTLAAAMRHRGYRPGTLLTVDWEPETFVVATPDARGTHRYDTIASARQVGGAVVLRMRGARVLLLLPDEVVPAAVRPTLSPRL